MNNLILIGIDNDVINKMIEKNSYNIVEDLDFNYEEVKDIINYFQKIGIEAINNLLINYTNIFFMDYEYIREKLEKDNLREIVDNINKDEGYLLRLLEIEE